MALRRVAGAAGALGFAVLTLWGGGRPTVYWVGDARLGGPGGSFVQGQSDVKRGEVIAFGSMNLCVEGGLTATVDKITFRDGENLVVRQFAVRPLDYSLQEGLGSLRGSIVEAGFTPGHAEVTTPCTGHNAPVSELALDVSNNSTHDATGRTIVVHYHSGRHRGEAEVPVTLKLCPGECS